MVPFTPYPPDAPNSCEQIKKTQSRARLGFEDSEFPDWWYSPARAEDEQERVEDVQGRDDDVLRRDTSNDDVQNEPSTNDDVLLSPSTPRNPVSREGGRGRPQLRTRDDTTRLETAEDDLTRRHSTQHDFTQDEINLLGSKGIVRSPQRDWFHSERYADGRTMITPVNPHVELRRLSDVRTNGTLARARATDT